MMNAAADVTIAPKLPVDTERIQDNSSAGVLRRDAVFGEVSCENGVTADETRPATRLAKDAENPLKTGVFQEVSAKGSGRSRTDDDGFAIRLTESTATDSNTSCGKARRSVAPKVALATAENGCESLTTVENSDCQNSALAGDVDPDLARVISSWPGLPEHLKAAVMALIATVQNSPRC